MDVAVRKGREKSLDVDPFCRSGKGFVMNTGSNYDEIVKKRR